jgi:hypothetical protein
MDSKTHEPKPASLSKVEGPALPVTQVVRHDGWTGEKMATFLETLAETAVVAEACEAARMHISGAYAARRRNPAFAAAWDAALAIARERLADTLLARSIEGNIEQIWRDGELVGERHLIDNKLGLAILRRLDRLAETGLSVSSRGERSPGAPAPSRRPIDWELALDALRTGDEAALSDAMAMFKGYEVEEVEGPPDSLIASGDDDELDLTDRCWFSEVDEMWLTDFPPPAGFTGWESRDYDDIADEDAYQRACTPEEISILEADAARVRGAERAEDEALRDQWFALLRDDCAEAGAAALREESAGAGEVSAAVRRACRPH